MILKSLLDQDFYKYTMGQVVLQKFPDFMVRYKFKCRNKGIVWTKPMVSDIEKELAHFCTLSLKPEEINFLKSIRFLKPFYIEYLKYLRPDMAHCKISLERDELNIEVAGPWFHTIWWEIPVLCIVNEVYFHHTTDYNKIRQSGIDRLQNKINLYTEFPFPLMEFGTRRRYSRIWQEYVVKQLIKDCGANFTGTSNPYLAMKYKVTPRGTMAHEFIQAGQACDGVTLANSQRYMFQVWSDVYRGDLGIALSDTLGFKKFLKDFDPYFSKLFDGARHDSGDPFEWARGMINHYNSLGINPSTKTLVFSDGLNFELADRINQAFGHQAKLLFGIGTNLTNDFEGVIPLQIVMKMVECNGRPVAKLSDSPGKTMCEDQDFMSYLRKVIS